MIFKTGNIAHEGAAKSIIEDIVFNTEFNFFVHCIRTKSVISAFWYGILKNHCILGISLCWHDRKEVIIADIGLNTDIILSITYEIKTHSMVNFL